MTIVTEVLGTVDTMRDRIDAEDAIMLMSEERSSPHMVGHSEGGRAVRISLPRGTELNDGDVLAIDEGTAIVVRAAAEALYVISPDDAYTWGVAGYQLGNLHRPVRFTADGMLTPADPMVSDLLGRLDIAFEEKNIPFVGKRYGAHSSNHHHEH
jgi:urease accessory protein